MDFDTQFDEELDTEEDFELDFGQASGDGTQFITFCLAEEDYGIEIKKVQEIISYRRLTKLPNTPEFIKGVLNLRGTVVPVVDLRCKFGMDEKDQDKRTVVIITEVQGRVMGAIVDTVSDVVSLLDSEINEPPSFSSKIRVDYIKGMAEKGSKFFVLLDVDRMMSDQDLAQVDAVG